MKIVLLRHGESVDDLLDCYGGCADYDLSENGLKTAKEVAKELKNIKIDKIYSSPLKRAQQTAAAVDKIQKCGIKSAEKLYERNSYGILSGTNKDECKKIFAHLLKDIKGKVGDYYSTELVLGAEPVSEFDKRVKQGMLDIVKDAKQNSYNTIAVVTHGNVTRSIYKNILKVNGKVDLDLLAVTYINYKHKFVLESNKGVEIK